MPLTPTVDIPDRNDNRSYDYTSHPQDERKEFQVILDLIEPHASVLDLGCGNGVLMERLKQERSANVQGVELSPSGVHICKEKQLHVIEGRIDEHLPFNDNTFDYAVCNVTIQMVMYPEVLLSEMKRVARKQIISFPNFAYYRNRIQFYRKGAMPTHMLFGYRWYSTGHIHQLSLTDFFQLVDHVGGLSVQSIHTTSLQNMLKQFMAARMPNLFMLLPIVVLKKDA